MRPSGTELICHFQLNTILTSQSWLTCELTAKLILERQGLRMKAFQVYNRRQTWMWSAERQTCIWIARSRKSPGCASCYTCCAKKLSLANFFKKLAWETESRLKFLVSCWQKPTVLLLDESQWTTKDDMSTKRNPTRCIDENVARFRSPSPKNVRNLNPIWTNIKSHPDSVSFSEEKSITSWSSLKSIG